MWLLPAFLAAFAIGYWLLLCFAGAGHFEWYPGQRWKRKRRQLPAPPHTPPPARLVTLCTCNSCWARRS